MSTEHKVCPHPRETWVKEPAVYSMRCPDCKARVCTGCRRYGWRDSMIPLVSWMTGTCDTCYSENQRRIKIRDQFEDERRTRETRQRIWDEARAAAADAVNPYAESTPFEQRLLDDNVWLREWVSP